MAENKKSFILYADMQGLFNQLPDEVAGKLIKHIYAYVNDENPTSNDILLNIAFEPIKMQLKRDLKNWEGTKDGRAESGRKGGIKSGIARREKKQNEANEANEANALNLKQNEANEAVNVNVNVNDTVNENVSNHTQFPIFEKFIFELTETEINAAKEINNRQTGQIPTEKDIGNWLYIFRQVNFTGQKFYENRTEIVKHFKNWVKSQKLQLNGNNQSGTTNGSPKLGTSAARMQYFEGLK